ncbi:MAG: metallophosphoesterase [Oscillospiraceae bacterium]|nr:metallophosphoesterase [Oscillospiraceae bacterium]
MALYAIADLHFSFSANKSMDIFEGWENYVYRLKENWISKITEKDTVVIAGDISWAPSLKKSFEDFYFLESLPGKKIIMRGNHDYWWSTRKKVETFFKNKNFMTLELLHNSAHKVENYAICGTRGWLIKPKSFKDEKIISREILRLKFSINLALKISSEPIVFFHFPPIFVSEVSEEILGVLIENGIKRCFYGHVHSKDAENKAFSGNYKGIEFKLISADMVNFEPIKI